MFIKLEKSTVNTDFIEEFNDDTIWFNNNDRSKSISAEEYKKLLGAVLPKEKIINNNAPKSELLELFEKLHKLTGGKGNTVFTLGREKKLSELMSKHRLTKENLIIAATNIGNDAFLQGDNDNKTRDGDIDYLLRPDKAAKWSEEQTQKKKGMF